MSACSRRKQRPALEGERKQVTVLFADVKGSMELAEQLDPEQWHAILDRFFAILTDGLPRSVTWHRRWARSSWYGIAGTNTSTRSPLLCPRNCPSDRASADFELYLLACLAEAQLGTDDAAAARTTAERAIRLAQERGTRGWEVRAHLAQARVLRALDGPSAKAAVEACLTRAEALVAETGAGAQTPFLIEERRLAMDLGNIDDGMRLLRQAQRAFEEIGAAGHAARLAAETGG